MRKLILFCMFLLSVTWVELVFRCFLCFDLLCMIVCVSSKFGMSELQ